MATFHHSLQQGFLRYLDFATWLDCLARKPWGCSCLHLPSNRIISLYYCAQQFVLLLRIQIQIPMLVWQTHCQLSRLPSPTLSTC